MKKLTIGAALAVAALATAVGVLNAQQPGFKRIEVQDRDLSIPGRHAVQARAEFEPGGAIGRHTHPGEELSIVLEGALLLEVERSAGEDCKGRRVVLHSRGRSPRRQERGTGKAVVFATYIVEKGKPVATPVK